MYSVVNVFNAILLLFPHIFKTYSFIAQRPYWAYAQASN